MEFIYLEGTANQEAHWRRLPYSFCFVCWSLILYYMWVITYISRRSLTKISITSVTKTIMVGKYNKKRT
jgi:hypothetical protein